MKIISSLLIIIAFFGCSTIPKETSIIKIKGSDTMYGLTENLAENFMKLRNGISVYVEGGGTSAGVTALVNGTIDILTASRNLTAEEIKKLADVYGAIGLSHFIAKDALSIYLNPENKVKNLSTEQIKKIYTGEISNWKEVGGVDQSIKVISRTSSSGTYLYFKEHLLQGEEYRKDVESFSTTNEIVEFVSENENAIGYGGIGYHENVFLCRINEIEPSIENVRNDTYPISRYLYFYTITSPRNDVKNFIEWSLSPDGQKVISSSGYIPIWERTY